MNYRKSFVLLLIIIVVTSCVFAAGESEYKMRIGSQMSSLDSCGMAVEKFAELVEAKSNGRIEALVFLSGELGGESELTEMTRDCTLEVSTPSSAVTLYVPENACLEFPYMYKDNAHQERVLKQLLPYMGEVLAPFNMKPIGYAQIGFRHFLNKKKPIYKVADLKGLKIRGPDPMYVGMINALGADGVTVDWQEVYSCLQTGVIDGMEASPSLIYAMKFYEQAKYLSKTYHIASYNYFLTCKSWFDGLPEDLQKVVLESADEASHYALVMLEEQEKDALDKMVADGVMINEVDDINEFREKCIKFRESLVQEGGPQYKKLYNLILAIE